MAYLRWRRMVEMAAVDRPWLGRLLLGGRGAPRPAPDVSYWDTEYRRGTYDRLLRSEQRHHHRLLAALVAESRPGLHVLEIGCGEGAFWEALRPFRPGRYLGIDVSPVAIEKAVARYAADVADGPAVFELADGAAYATEERFDAIVFPECIEYLGDAEQVVTHYQGLLRPGGCIGLTMWLGGRPVRRWWRLRDVVEVQDEAIVNAAWGGAWLVALLKPRGEVIPPRS